MDSWTAPCQTPLSFTIFCEGGDLFKMAVGTSLAVQLLGLHASTAGGMVPSLGGLRSFLWGLSSHMLCGMAKKKKKKW